MTGLFSRRRSS
uniref:Uncharacterized protein n=1 Tax=Arundo donax TaxID=35708 RepID=A0A0A9C0J5_ARUDO